MVNNDENDSHGILSNAIFIKLITVLIVVLIKAQINTLNSCSIDNYFLAFNRNLNSL